MFQYIGGKKQLAKRIIQLMPPHKVYVEPFFGSGAVFFRKPLAEENVLNDINADITNVFICIKDEPFRFLDMMIKIPPTEETANFAWMYYQNKQKWLSLSNAERAAYYMRIVGLSYNRLLSKHGLSSDGMSGGWADRGLLEKVYSLHKFLLKANAVIYSRDFRQIMSTYDKPGVFMYIDPPYMVTTESENYYQNTNSSGFTMQDHTDLRDMLLKARYKFILSYDDHSKIHELYGGRTGIYVHRINMYAASKNSHYTELLITNYNIADSSPLFSGELSGDIELNLEDE